jgi:hypothetical protein
MNKTTTLKDLANFSKNETELVNQLGLNNETVESPSKKSVEFILNFSKVYSVRKSKNIGIIESLLN